MVHHQDRDVEAVGDGFERGHDFIVSAIAVALGFHLPDALQGVDDHKAHVRVRGEEVSDLLLEAFAQKLGLGGDPDLVRLAARDLAQALLDTLFGVLQADIQHLAGRCLKLPDFLALAHTIR